MSENVVNLSNRQLRKAEISLLSKSLKFYPTPNSVDKSVVKEDLEKFGRILSLKWHYRMINGPLILICFGLNLNLILAKLMQLLIYILVILKRNFFLALKLNMLITNLTREEGQAMYNLKKNCQSIVIKEADKGSAMVTWDKKDYVMEAEK